MEVLAQYLVSDKGIIRMIRVNSVSRDIAVTNVPKS